MRRLVLFCFSFVLFATIGGCASSICKPGVLTGGHVTFAKSSPGVEDIIANVPAGVAAICTIRPTQFYKCGGPMYIQFNGKEIGPLANQTYMITYVQPGTYEITSQEPSIWDKTKSVSGRLRLEAHPGRAYFVSGTFHEGSVDLHLLSAEKAREAMKDTVRILAAEKK
jgi:hypothetical protein